MKLTDRASLARRTTEQHQLRALSVDPEAEVREAARENPALPPEWKRLLERAGAYVDAYVVEVGEAWTDWNGAEVSRAPTEVRRESIPLDPALPSQDLEPLLELSPFSRVLVARHPAAAMAQLARLVAGGEREVVEALAKATRSPELLDQLSTQRAAAYAVACSPFTGPATLARLATNESEYVRARVAEHRATPAEALVTLAGDGSSKVLEALAGNRAAPAEALAKVSPTGMVRDALVNNPSTPAAVREAVLLEMARSTDWLTRSAVGSCRVALPASVIALLLADASKRVRASLATHHALPRDAFDRLAADPESDVRRAVVENPRCPDDLHRRLKEDPDSNVRAGWRERVERT